MAEKNKTSILDFNTSSIQIFMLIVIDSVGTYISYSLKDTGIALFLAGITAMIMWIAKTRKNKAISLFATVFIIIICLPRSCNQADHFSENNQDRKKGSIVLEKEFPTPKEPRVTDCDNEKGWYKDQCQQKNNELISQHSKAVMDITAKNAPIKERNSKRLEQMNEKTMSTGDWSLVYVSAILSVFLPIFFFFLIHPELQFGLSQEELIIKLYRLNLPEAEIIKRSGATRSKVAHTIKNYVKRVANSKQNANNQQTKHEQSRTFNEHSTNIHEQTANKREQSAIKTVLWANRGKADPLSARTSNEQRTARPGGEI